MFDRFIAVSPHHFLASFLLASSFALAAAPALAQSTPAQQSAPNAIVDTSPFNTPARNAVIMDYQSGEVLYEKNARPPMPPASMTKIMTATVVFDMIKSGELSLDQEFTVSEDAWRRGGVKSGSSTMFLKPKSKVRVEDLLKGVIVQSGNDACIVLAQGIAGSEAGFANLMNKKAEALGLTSAHFVNATGWPDPDHYISAYDLAKLAHHTISSYPELYKIYGMKDFTWNGIKQDNRNPLIMAGYPGADGLKTGHTKISKYGVVGTAEHAGTRRIFVLNGLESKGQRREESLRTIDAAFNQFDVYALYQQGAEAGRATVYMGKADSVPLVVAQAVNIGLHKTQRADISAQISYQSPIPAPVSAGSHIADLQILKDGQLIKTVPLNAGQDVAVKSAWSRITASAIAKIRGENKRDKG